MLRLLRDDLGDDAYRQENRSLRDAARALSRVRDAAVLVQMYDGVVKAGTKEIPEFRSALVERHATIRQEVLDDDILPKVREEVAAAVARIDSWPLGEIHWDVLGGGLKRVYRRGRKAMAAAYDDPTTEHFHSWRNRAKYLRHQVRLLKDLWPEVVGGTAKSVHDLTRTLGEEHDLAVLERAAVADGLDPDAFGGYLAARRELLRARARPIGLRVYAEKPSRFIARLGRYWEAGLQPAAA